MQELISIVIPIYNAVSYLRRCIDTVRNQSYRKIEIILVDDGSTDGSSRLCDNYAALDSRIIVIHSRNCGVSHARNLGLDRARGVFICFVDADDAISEQYVNILYSNIEQSDADISMFERVNGFTDTISRSEKKISYTYPYRIYSSSDAVKSILYYKTPIGCYSRLFRREFLIDYSLRFNENLSIGEGFNFNIDCFLKARSVCVLPQRQYYYRLDNPKSAMTHMHWDKIWNGLKAINLIAQKLSSFSEYNESINYAVWHTYCDFYLTILGSVSLSSSNIDSIEVIRRRVKSVPHHFWTLSISWKQKTKIFMFWLLPRSTGLVINHFRVRNYS